MKKFIILMMAVMFSLVTKAQTAIQTSKFLDNTYVGINAGVTTPLSMDKAMPLNPTFGIRVGKDFTPVFGINIEGTTWFGSNLGKYHFGKNAFRAVNVGVNPTINWTNLIAGYKGSPRPIEFITVTGLGWLHTFSRHNNALSAKTALDIAWNFSPAWQFYIEPGLFWDLSQGNEIHSIRVYDNNILKPVWVNQYNVVQFTKQGAQLFLNVGLTYKFKTSNGTHNFKLINVGELNDEINSLRNDLAKKPKVVTETITKDVVINNTITTVFFAQNSAELSNNAKAVLDNITGNVKVYGYASPEGTSEYNKNLSIDRAEVVANYLKNRNINIISCEGLGVIDSTSNRVVIIYNK